MQDRIKQHFASKIDSFDKYRQAMQACSPHSPERYTPYDICSFMYDPINTMHVAGMETCDISASTAQNFWWWREQARIAMIYPARTSIMQEAVRNLRLGQYCVYPSTDPATPEAVCYTPDPAMGVADRQIKVSSFGKLLRKLVPLLTDEHVQKLEAAHRAELDPTVTVAHDAETIVEVYRTMSGDTGCMRYDHDRWGLPAGYHPAQVYAGEKIGVAYHKVGGVIKSRAVVFETEDGDKHYVRVYGDSALKGKLERAGYTAKSIDGAKIKVIRPHGDQCMVPYIDGVNGNQSNTDGTYGYIDKRDPEHIVLVSRAARDSLVNAGVLVANFKAHSSVMHAVPVVDVEEFTFICAVTGRKVNRTTEKAIYVWLDDALQQAEYNAHHLFNDYVYIRKGGIDTRVYYKADEPRPPTFDSLYFDDHDTRTAKGYRLLSTHFYPETTYCPTSEVASIMHNNEVQIVRKADTLCVIAGNDDTEFVFDADGKKQRLLKKQSYVSIPPHKNIRRVCHTDNPKLVKLVSNKWSLRSNAVQLFNGDWVPARGIDDFFAFGSQWQYLRGTSVEVLAEFVPEDYIRAKFVRGHDSFGAVADHAVAHGNSFAHDQIEIARQYVSKHCYRVIDFVLNRGAHGGRIPYIRMVENQPFVRVDTYHNYTDVTSVRQTLAHINAHPDQLDLLDPLNAKRVRSWAKAAEIVLGLCDALTEAVEARIATQGELHVVA